MSLPLAALSLLLLCQTQAASVSFDLRALPEQDYRRWEGLELERKVALRLVQEGLAVVAPDAPAEHVRITAERTREGLVLIATGRGTELREEVRADAGSLAALHLEIAQKASALARRLAREAPVSSTKEIVPKSKPEVTAPVVGADATPPARGLELSASGGASWRGSAVDPLALIAIGHAFGPVELGAEVGLAPSRSAALSVFELQAAAFAGHRIAFGGGARWFLEPGLGAGVLLHSFHLDDRWANETDGTRASPAAWARLRAGFAITPKLTLAVRLAAGVATPLLHQSEGETMWERSALRLETGATLGWSL